MAPQIGDRVRLTDAHDFDIMRDEPLTALELLFMGDTRTELPEVGDIGTVERLVTPMEELSQGAPVDGFYVRFDNKEGTWGINPGEVEILTEEVAA